MCTGRRCGPCRLSREGPRPGSLDGMPRWLTRAMRGRRRGGGGLSISQAVGSAGDDHAGRDSPRECWHQPAHNAVVIDGCRRREGRRAIRAALTARIGSGNKHTSWDKPGTGCRTTDAASLTGFGELVGSTSPLRPAIAKRRAHAYITTPTPVVPTPYRHTVRRNGRAHARCTVTRGASSPNATACCNGTERGLRLVVPGNQLQRGCEIDHPLGSGRTRWTGRRHGRE